MLSNDFKQRLARGERQIGLWLALADTTCAEICAGAGFDWLALDAEHAPNTLRTLLAQLQAIAAYPVHPVVRATHGGAAHIKQLLDIGAQTLLVPMVESAAQAAEIVCATRYPPEGMRGVGSALARASRWNRISGYLQRADEEICVLMQVESVTGLGNLEAIARTAGVDGVFIGPSDLAASLGHRGEPGHPRVREAIFDALRTLRAAGKPAGILAVDEAFARECLAAGCSFVAVGADAPLLARATSELAARFGARGSAGASRS